MSRRHSTSRMPPPVLARAPCSRSKSAGWETSTSIHTCCCVLVSPSCQLVLDRWLVSPTHTHTAACTHPPNRTHAPARGRPPLSVEGGGGSPPKWTESRRCRRARPPARPNPPTPPPRPCCFWVCVVWMIDWGRSGGRRGDGHAHTMHTHRHKFARAQAQRRNSAYLEAAHVWQGDVGRVGDDEVEWWGGGGGGSCYIGGGGHERLAACLCMCVYVWGVLMSDRGGREGRGQSPPTQTNPPPSTTTQVLPRRA